MKKWVISLLISMACFCFFLYMNGFCEIIPLPIIGGLSAKRELYQFYGIHVLGISLPFMLVILLSIIALSIFVLSVFQVIKHMNIQKKHLLLLILILPVFLITYVSQEKAYIYPVYLDMLAFDVEYYQSITVDQNDNTIHIFNSAYGIAQPVVLKANASSIRIVEDAIKRNESMSILYRKNRLLNLQYIDGILIKNKIQCRAHLQGINDFRTGSIAVYNGQINIVWPWSTPTPAPTEKPARN